MFDFYQNRYELKKLLRSQEWPQAIEEDLLTHDETARAHSIIYLMVGPDLLPKTKSLLDYGCGSNKVVEICPEYNIQNAVGYDIQGPGVTNFQEVIDRGPYDAIIANDVLDHLVGETIDEAVIKMKSVLSPDGHIFIRCHPYISRTGTHLPSYGINKAYAHLFFPELTGEHTLKIQRPAYTYQESFYRNGLIIEYRVFCRQKIEEFFTENEQLFSVFQKITETEESYQMRLQNVEYVLRATQTTDLSTDSSSE